MIPVALTIAGSDSGGGAGIQADLKTFSALGVFGTSALTALTAQNTLGVSAVHAPPPDFVAAQIAAVLTDFRVGAAKTGMLHSAEIITAVAEALAEAPDLPLVVDPVMIATSGDPLIRPEAVMVMVKKLFPRAALVTPNLAEAAALTHAPIAQDLDAMQRQGEAIRAMGARAVLMKSGHAEGAEAIDLLVSEEGTRLFSAPRVETRHTHGTGCTLSAAIAAGLARGQPMEEAIGEAKAYLTAALVAGRELGLGHGNGPVHHFHALRAR